MKTKKIMAMALATVLSLSISVGASAQEIGSSTTSEKSSVKTVSFDNSVKDWGKPVPVPAQTRGISASTYTHSGSYVHDIATNSTTYVGSSQITTRAKSSSTENFSAGYFPNGITQPSDISLDGVVGSDDRTRVNPTNVGPYCNTVSLLITAGNGGSYIGSGFMIGPKAVATVGHCVYEEGTGGWAKSIKVIPARNGTSYPYGYAYSTGFECGGNWLNSSDNQDDWGVITIDSNLGNQTGWLGLHWQSSSYNGTSIINTGYPGNVKGSANPGYMYKGTGTITSSSARTLAGNWDSSGGNSGGPIFMSSSTSGYIAIAILRGGADGANAYSDGTRIDEWIYNKFITYR